MSTSRFRTFSLAAICFQLLVIGGTIDAYGQTRSYVVLSDGAIAVLDTATNAVVNTITVCTDFTCSPLIPAATPNGARLYVTNFSHNTVSVIDTLTNKVIDTITVGPSPWGVAITPDGKRAYVASSSGTISVIDTGTNDVIDTIAESDGPLGVAITPDGTRAYVSNGAGTVSVINTSTNTLITKIPLFNRFGFPASGLLGIAITPNGTRAYVISNGGAQTSVIDTTLNAVFTNISTLPDTPFSIAMSPDGTRVYTSAVGFGVHVLVIDTFTDTIIATIPGVGPPPFVGVTPDGKRLYIDAIDSTGEGGVTIVDTSTFGFVTRIQLGHPMGGVAFATLPEVPHSKDDCKDGGFQRFSVLAFRNQGQCIKYVNEHAN